MLTPTLLKVAVSGARLPSKRNRSERPEAKSEPVTTRRWQRWEELPDVVYLLCRAWAPQLFNWAMHEHNQLNGIGAAYIRVSEDQQETGRQYHSIHEFEELPEVSIPQEN